ncbi:MAG: hypothetical protein ACRC1T_05215 [Clostridium chrysemydis]|uniref:hypothetical protein n=1 Tax=Clostridium chrysemydis TaxID=2665504 RepID=UPI003F324B62
MIKEDIETALKSDPDTIETLKDKTVKAYEDRIVIYDKDNKPLRIFDFKDLNDTLVFICHTEILNYLKSTYSYDIMKTLFAI